MNWFKQRLKLKKLPHAIYPEIALWKEGDEFEKSSSLEYGHFTLETVTSDGQVFVESYGKKILTITYVMKNYRNTDLANRLISEKQQNLKKNDDYMQFLKDFQEAYEEIRK